MNNFSESFIETKNGKIYFAERIVTNSKYNIIYIHGLNGVATFAEKLSADKRFFDANIFIIFLPGHYKSYKITSNTTYQDILLDLSTVFSKIPNDSIFIGKSFGVSIINDLMYNNHIKPSQLIYLSPYIKYPGYIQNYRNIFFDGILSWLNKAEVLKNSQYPIANNRIDILIHFSNILHTFKKSSKVKTSINALAFIPKNDMLNSFQISRCFLKNYSNIEVKILDGYHFNFDINDILILNKIYEYIKIDRSNSTD